MHKQLSALLSDGGSPGQLAKFTQVLADKGANIRSLGGCQWEHRGAVAVLIDNHTPELEAEVIGALEEAKIPTAPIFAAEAVLPDEPGALAAAATLLADLDILTVLVADTHMGKGLVSFGFATFEEAQEALVALGYLGRPEHSLTAAWQAHEDWDQTNPNQAPTP